MGKLSHAESITTIIIIVIINSYYMMIMVMMKMILMTTMIMITVLLEVKYIKNLNELQMKELIELVRVHHSYVRNLLSSLKKFGLEWDSKP